MMAKDINQIECNNPNKVPAPPPPPTKSSSINNFEDILQQLGGFGPYQFLTLFLLLILEIPTAFVVFIPIFVGKVPELWTNGNETVSVQDICEFNGTRFPENPDAVEESIVAQWELICNKAWVFDFITSIQMLGMFVGSIAGSQLADWFGRKLGYLGATLLLIIGSVMSASSGDPYIYAVSRFICGVGVTSFMNVTLVGVVEVMPPKYRSLSNCIGPTGEGLMILSVMAYFIRPWRNLFWWSILPFSLILIIYPFVQESPRWLIKQGRIEQAHDVLSVMAKLNSRPPVGLEVVKKICEKESLSANTKARFSFLDFVRDKTLRKTSIYNMAIWFAWSLTYYGISFNIKNVKGDIYFNVFLMGLVNALGQRAALLINDSMGRRKALFASMSFCALFLVILAICEIILDHEDIPIAVLSLCLLGQFGMASARSAARLLSGESFPTAVRTMGMGIGGITANIAGIMTPQLAYLGSTWPSIPFFTFACVSVGGSLVVFLMDETTGRPLDDHVPPPPAVDDDSEAGHTNKCFVIDEDDDNQNPNSISVNPSPYSTTILIPYNTSKSDLISNFNFNNSSSTPVLVSISKLAEGDAKKVFPYG